MAMTPEEAARRREQLSERIAIDVAPEWAEQWEASAERRGSGPSFASMVHKGFAATGPALSLSQPSSPRVSGGKSPQLQPSCSPLSPPAIPASSPPAGGEWPAMMPSSSPPALPPSSTSPGGGGGGGGGGRCCACEGRAARFGVFVAAASPGFCRLRRRAARRRRRRRRRVRAAAARGCVGERGERRGERRAASGGGGKGKKKKGRDASHCLASPPSAPTRWAPTRTRAAS